ncbi:transposase (putative), gypsy type [Artemisia annua]|uniref:Transposase (Putative), gypsy type n=1 Tax=Artemisia annua TaxID=35608 RepID=A0A2U1N8B3_ARTAN|nr:transposase (putative), gypsy type [Artemisia annua]
MAEFLELPDWEGTSFSVGEQLPAGHQRPNRTTPPRAAGQAIPAKDHLMKKAEKADEDVLNAKEKKEQEARRRAALKRAGEGSSAAGAEAEEANGPQSDLDDIDLFLNEDGRVQGNQEGNDGDNAEGHEAGENIAGGGGGLVGQEEAEGSRHERSVSPHIHPVNEEAPRDSHPAASDGHSVQRSGPSKRPVINILSDADQSVQQADRFIPEWSLRNDVRLNSYCACRELLVHLPTPAEQAALDELDNIELARQGYEYLGTSTVTQAEILRRFRHLNADYRELSTIHEGCSGAVEKAEQERDAQADRYGKLEADFNGLQWRYEAVAKREKELFEASKGFDREREVWLEKNAEQADRINQLEAQLAASQEQVNKLTVDKADLTASLAQEDIVRQNLVKSLFPTVFRRLSDSREYKQALVKPFSLAYSAGWKEGVRVGRTAEEAEKIYSTSKKVNREAPAVWKAEFNKVFALEFPYIKKIVDSHRLPLGDLMNIFPDSPTPLGLLSAPGPTVEAPTGHTAESDVNAS